MAQRPLAAKIPPPESTLLPEQNTVDQEAKSEIRSSSSTPFLTSGENSHLGKIVTHGDFSGYAIYGISLQAEELTNLYLVNINDENNSPAIPKDENNKIKSFFSRIEAEIAALAAQHSGVMIYLHHSGEFFSAEYVDFWRDILWAYKNVACFGFTNHPLPPAVKRSKYSNDRGNPDPKQKLPGNDIGYAIENGKYQIPDRFRIRWFSETIIEDGATSTNPDEVSSDLKVATVKCPIQDAAHATCATCGICWSVNNNCVLLLKEGESFLPAPPVIAIEDLSLLPDQISEIRTIVPISLGKKYRPSTTGEPPVIKWVNPRTLKIEANYQRQLNAKSRKLIKKIAVGWDWTKFKPPVCSPTKNGLFIIDGQHTAIGAVTHGEIPEIPVIISSTENIEERACAFISHNRDRLIMSVFDIFHAELAATLPEATQIAKIAEEAGCLIPSSQPGRKYAKPGQIAAITEMRLIYRALGDQALLRILRIVSAAKLKPVTTLPLRALRRMITSDAYNWRTFFSDTEIAEALGSIYGLDVVCRAYAVQTGQDEQRACIMLLKQILETRKIGKLPYPK